LAEIVTDAAPCGSMLRSMTFEVSFTSPAQPP
jgi:hypothetical protein